MMGLGEEQMSAQIPGASARGRWRATYMLIMEASTDAGIDMTREMQEYS